MDGSAGRELHEVAVIGRFVEETVLYHRSTYSGVSGMIRKQAGWDGGWRGTYEPPFVEGHGHERVQETVRGRAFVETEGTVMPDTYAIRNPNYTTIT